jgi:hypothetical protein
MSLVVSCTVWLVWYEIVVVLEVVITLNPPLPPLWYSVTSVLLSLGDSSSNVLLARTDAARRRSDDVVIGKEICRGVCLSAEHVDIVALPEREIDRHRRDLDITLAVLTLGNDDSFNCKRCCTNEVRLSLESSTHTGDSAEEVSFKKSLATCMVELYDRSEFSDDIAAWVADTKNLAEVLPEGAVVQEVIVLIPVADILLAIEQPSKPREDSIWRTGLTVSHLELLVRVRDTGKSECAENREAQDHCNEGLHGEAPQASE